MALWIRKRGLENEIKNLKNCSEFEFKKKYPGILAQINSYPIESARVFLLIDLDNARRRYERANDQRYTFGDWRRLL